MKNNEPENQYIMNYQTTNFNVRIKRNPTLQGRVSFYKIYLANSFVLQLSYK